MGIYISGVKGLPEQVQENKNKIKEVEEQIEGIDFDAVRQLQGQVAENTQDINNLEASIGVQNQAINSLNDDVDALERKTQLMTYNDDLSTTDFRNTIQVADDVIASGIHVNGDGVMVNSKGSGLHFQEGANDDVLTIANQDGAVAHYLHFNADGTLDIDGNPVGGKTLYNHNITLEGSQGSLKINLVLEKSEAITTQEFYNILITNGFTSQANMYRVSEILSIDFTTPTFKRVRGIYAANNYIYFRIYDSGSSQYSNIGNNTVGSDQIIPTA